MTWMDVEPVFITGQLDAGGEREGTTISCDDGRWGYLCSQTKRGHHEAIVRGLYEVEAE
jgi:hypothetical protein